RIFSRVLYGRSHRSLDRIFGTNLYERSHRSSAEILPTNPCDASHRFPRTILEEDLCEASQGQRPDLLQKIRDDWYAAVTTTGVDESGPGFWSQPEGVRHGLGLHPMEGEASVERCGDTGIGLLVPEELL